VRHEAFTLSTHNLTPMQNKALSLSAVFMLPPILKNHDRETHGKILSEIAKIVDSGQLKPMIDPHKLTLETVTEAHALLESENWKFQKIINCTRALIKLFAAITAAKLFVT